MLEKPPKGKNELHTQPSSPMSRPKQGPTHSAGAGLGLGSAALLDSMLVYGAPKGGFGHHDVPVLGHVLPGSRMCGL